MKICMYICKQGRGSRRGAGAQKLKTQKARLLVYKIKFTHFGKATNFCEISTVNLTVTYTGHIYGRDFTKFCGLLKIYELYVRVE